MKTKDWERLSAYLDGELNERERRTLEARLSQDAELASALEELRKTRSLLHQLPRRTVPRDFSVQPSATPEPRPSSWVPGLRWGAALGGALCAVLVALSFVLGPGTRGLPGGTQPGLAFQMEVAPSGAASTPTFHAWNPSSGEPGGGGPGLAPVPTLVPTTAAGVVPGEESPTVATPKRATADTAVAATPTPTSEMHILSVPAEPSETPAQMLAACAPPAPGSDASCGAGNQAAGDGLTLDLRLAGLVTGGLALIALAISVLLAQKP